MLYRTAFLYLYYTVFLSVFANLNIVKDWGHRICSYRSRAFNTYAVARSRWKMHSASNIRAFSLVRCESSIQLDYSFTTIVARSICWRHFTGRTGTPESVVLKKVLLALVCWITRTDVRCGYFFPAVIKRIACIAIDLMALL